MYQIREEHSSQDLLNRFKWWGFLGKDLDNFITLCENASDILFSTLIWWKQCLSWYMIWEQDGCLGVPACGTPCLYPGVWSGAHGVYDLGHHPLQTVACICPGVWIWGIMAPCMWCHLHVLVYDLGAWWLSAHGTPAFVLDSWCLVIIQQSITKTGLHKFQVKFD